MKRLEKHQTKIRLSASLILCAAALPLAGCSQDFTSADDAYTPYAVEQRFPIAVVEKPRKMSVSASGGQLHTDDVNRLVRFAREVGTTGASTVHVTYPKGSTKARKVAGQAVQILTAQGVSRGMIHTGQYSGKSDVVSLSFSRKIAVTKECGDWSRDVANDPDNRPHPDFGCSMQNNVAAMVANPEDLERPRTMDPAHAASRMPTLDGYNSGESVQSDDGGDTFIFFPAQ